MYISIHNSLTVSLQLTLESVKRQAMVFSLWTTHKQI